MNKNKSTIVITIQFQEVDKDQNKKKKNQVDTQLLSFIQKLIFLKSDLFTNNKNNEQIYFEDFTQGSLKRSKLRNVYLTLPVDFQWVLNPKYTDYEDQKYLDGKSRQFRIGAGVYAGVNLRNIVKVKYYDQDNKFSKYDYTLDHGVNTFLFGAKLSVSYGGINLFIKKDLTPIFNDHALFPNKNGIQIGIEIANIDF